MLYVLIIFYYLLPPPSQPLRIIRLWVGLNDRAFFISRYHITQLPKFFIPAATKFWNVQLNSLACSKDFEIFNCGSIHFYLQDSLFSFSLQFFFSIVLPVGPCDLKLFASKRVAFNVHIIIIFQYVLLFI